ncbi:iron-sulfur cluster assembly ATPase protein SufC [Mycobacteroides abscessus subsp. massiliense CCUG 48898 = JCM 15300]|nr:iron-sulfur cluster assembly ATPase protein SufC [Mycobacteroides abscessus subsp. massiliense CCUG 48898 = JCM 15300]
MKVSQKWNLPRRSSSRRPVIFGNQKYIDERARAGLFLAMQYPVEVPGVSMSNFLRTAATAVRGEAPKLRHWVKEVKEAMGELEIDSTFAERSVNEGFSGGEKKRHEILQLGLLKPKIAVLDETDSGLDVDARVLLVPRRR